MKYEQNGDLIDRLQTEDINTTVIDRKNAELIEEIMWLRVELEKIS